MSSEDKSQLVPFGLRAMNLISSPYCLEIEYLVTNDIQTRLIFLFCCKSTEESSKLGICNVYNPKYQSSLKIVVAPLKTYINSLPANCRAHCDMFAREISPLYWYLKITGDNFNILADLNCPEQKKWFSNRATVEGEMTLVKN